MRLSWIGTDALSGSVAGWLKSVRPAAIYNGLSQDLPKPRMPSGRTPNRFRPQFEAWVLATRGEAPTPNQHPIDDLLGEHHFLRLVLVAMQTEAVRLASKKNMDVDFWAGAVDVIGNFGLLLHWRKKATHLFPTIRSLGFTELLEKLDREQQRDIETTLDLCDAVSEGDGEKVVRLVSLYTDSKRRHLEREEDSVLLPAKDALDVAAIDALRIQFDEVDASALPGADRLHYLEVGEQALRHVGIELFGEPPDEALLAH